MYLFRKSVLAVLGIAFCLGLFAASSNAQWTGNSSWQNRNRQTGYYRYGRISPQEYRRLARERHRLYERRNRYNNDGYISDKERRKLQKKYQKYRRDVRRDRRDWN